jgi:multidrug efflux system outer membrane protein
MRTLPALALVSVTLAGCAVGPNYTRPAVATPSHFRGQVSPTQAASLADRPWWTIFDDPALGSLIDEALRNNYDLRAAGWRVEQARAEAGIAGSTFLPEVQAAAGWSRSRPSSYQTGVSIPPESLYDVNLGLSWEVDLWGRIRRLDEEALATYLGTEEARRGVMLSLVADVATSYFELRQLDLQLEIARRTTAAFTQTRDLFNRRLAAGAASALETASAEASLASTAANIPDLERQIAAQENTLSLLLGRPPGDVARGAELNDQPLLPDVPAGLPSELLERRPDVREAEQALIAANAAVGVATANLFPTISLTGAFGGVAPQVSELLGKGRSWSVGGGLLTPIIQGKRLSEARRAAVAQWQQTRLTYEKTVTNAFVEVSTALVAYGKLADVEAQQAKAVSADREAVTLANQRYVAGLADYLEVLQAEQQLYPAENALAQTRFARLATLVELYKALGGGWKLPDSEWSSHASAAAASHGGT